MRELEYDATLEIHMDNLLSNLAYFKSLLKPQTKIMVMVKAFSYGLGTSEVAKLLEKNDINYLGVANTFEGMELRKAGIKLPIMVMKPQMDSFHLIQQHQLTPTIFSKHSLEQIIRTLDNSKPLSISIKIDTGMHRLGFEENEVSELIKNLKANPFLKVESVFSHLAAAEDINEDEYTANQIRLFKTIAEKMSYELGYAIDKHILNTNGIIRYNDAQMDMVRLGIGLYGVSADKKTQEKLLPISTLKSKISQIKKIKKGTTIGYNRMGVATKNITIATIPVGYADGLNRNLSNGNWSMIVNNKKAPIIGNICMDMVMIDITNINCKITDEVLIFSPQNSISEMAKCIGTIPYEVLTTYSPRIQRWYKY